MSFTQTLAVSLAANLLTLLFAYSVWAYSRVERSGLYMWNALAVLIFAMYGVYSFPTDRPTDRQRAVAGVSEVSSGSRAADRQPASARSLDTSQGSPR
jgi:hypothetical protein